VIGRRIPDSPDGAGMSYAPGDYSRIDGVWYGSTPTGEMANLRNHTVTEHEDGTITVSPSILVFGANRVELWHGYLERGVWRSC
jgi:hypothetical protein